MDTTRSWAIAAGIVALLAAPAAAAGDQRVVQAVKSGDAATVSHLLRERADVNGTYGDGSTALHWAAYRNDSAIIEQLLRAGAKVDVANDLGVRPIALASANGNTAIVRRFLAEGSDPNASTLSGVTALMEAAKAGHAQTVSVLLESGARVDARESSHDQTALMWAIARRHADVVRVLLDHGASVSARSRATSQVVLLQPSNDGSGVRSVKTARQIGKEVPKGGGTPLMFAAWSGDLESARLLIAAGADVNDQAADGSSALIAAVHGGFTPFAMYLLDKGADPNRATNFFALHAAALRSDRAVVESLLRHGANPNSRILVGTPVRRFGLAWVFPATLVGASPLLVASNFSDLDVMRQLIAGSADPNLTMQDGTTPLMAAVSLGGQLSRPPLSVGERVCLNSAGFTVACTAKDAAPAPTGPDAVPETPLTTDPAGRAYAAAKLLIEAGADVRAAAESGDTALHIAAARSLTRVIELLVEYGADVQAKNAHEKTPLQLAAGAATDLLQKLGARE